MFRYPKARSQSGWELHTVDTALGRCNSAGGCTSISDSEDIYATFQRAETDKMNALGG